MILVYDADSGRITQTLFTHEPNAVASLEGQGLKVWEVGRDQTDMYFDVEDPDRPALRLRPVYETSPSSMTPKSGEVVTLGSPPPCTFIVNGPFGLGEIQHPGGPADLTFSMPGDYVVEWEAFPYRVVSWSFKVLSNLTDGGNV